MQPRGQLTLRGWGASFLALEKPDPGFGRGALIMPELKLGSKHECFSCGTKFYDLGKSEVLCPKCGANQKDAVTSDSLAASQSSRRRRKADLSKSLEVEDDEPIDIADDEMVGPELDEEAVEAEEEEEELDEAE